MIRLANPASRVFKFPVILLMWISWDQETEEPYSANGLYLIWFDQNDIKAYLIRFDFSILFTSMTLDSIQFNYVLTLKGENKNSIF